MEVKLIKGAQADYAQATWKGINDSGLKVFGARVLVCMDHCSEKTIGGVVLTDELREKMDMASESGCVYAVGPQAFKGEEDAPKAGDRVYVERYSGIVARGIDGFMYRIMEDTCIAAGLAFDDGAETKRAAVAA